MLKVVLERHVVLAIVGAEVLSLISQIICPDFALVTPLALECLSAPRVAHLYEPPCSVCFIIDNQRAQDRKSMVERQAIKVLVLVTACSRVAARSDHRVLRVLEQHSIPDLVTAILLNEI